MATHGTGTPLGDPIETGAIGSALGKLGAGGRCQLALSSVKATYGHTEGAAGKSPIMVVCSCLCPMRCGSWTMARWNSIAASPMARYT